MKEVKARGYRIRSGKAGKDICVMTEQDAANYVMEHYQSGKLDDITIKPITDEEDLYGRDA